jgi:hypothetical protein
VSFVIYFIIKTPAFLAVNQQKESKSLPVTGRGDLQGSETSRIHFPLSNRLKDGGKVVGVTLRPLFTHQEDSWYSFLLETGRIV